jgi:hypothetical protein
VDIREAAPAVDTREAATADTLAVLAVGSPEAAATAASVATAAASATADLVSLAWASKQPTAKRHLTFAHRSEERCH